VPEKEPVQYSEAPLAATPPPPKAEEPVEEFPVTRYELPPEEPVAEEPVAEEEEEPLEEEVVAEEEPEEEEEVAMVEPEPVVEEPGMEEEEEPYEEEMVAEEEPEEEEEVAMEEPAPAEELVAEAVTEEEEEAAEEEAVAEEETPEEEEEVAAVQEEPPPPATVAAAPQAAPEAPPVQKAEKPVVQPVVVNFEAEPLFSFDRYNIRADQRGKLDELVRQLNGTSYESVSVAGHADRIGTEQYNLKLSQRRADSVKAYLVRKGIPADKITTEAHGESQPVTTEEECKGKRGARLIACYAPDRRVDVSVTAEKSN